MVAEGERAEMIKVHPDGIFAAELPGTVLDYRLDVDGTECDDPYRHLPTLGELDLHLIGEGRHEKLWKVLGAQPRGTGVGFAVWAPSARGVQVVGDFAGWGPYDGWPMRSLGSSGVWEIYVPNAHVGHQVQVQDPRPGRGVARARRPDGPAHRDAAGHRLGRLRVDVRVAGRRLDARAGRPAAGTRSR